MDQVETLALLEKGKTAWNEWALGMQAKRRALEASRSWQPGGMDTPINEETKKWLNDARVTFSTRDNPKSFPVHASFIGFVFPSVSIWTAATFEERAEFQEVTFGGLADFSNSRFVKGADFARSVFQENVEFMRSTFFGLADFDSTNFLGTAGFGNATFHKIARFLFTRFVGSASFSNAVFQGGTVFSKITFGRGASFQSSTFAAGVMFTSTSFEGGAQFSGASFEKHADFRNMNFGKSAAFSSASFLGDALFDNSIFKGSANFNSACFAQTTSFSKTQFQSTSSFNSAQIKQAFDLSGASFCEVPDFRQTHCEEAPLLDDVSIRSAMIKKGDLTHEADFTVTANYRALKRLAIQAHDHKHEVEFFAEELKSRRLMVYTPRDPNWWLSFIFEELSDYGRSIVRPLVYWLGVVMVSAVHYIALATPLDPDRATKCLAGTGSQVNTAYQLAFAKGLLVPGLADRTIITQAYECLFGAIVPGSATAVTSIQTLLSAILFFLLLLGIRNRFKLK